MAGNDAKKAGVQGSISRKYALGYVIILLAMLLLFAASSVFHRLTLQRYEAQMDDLLGLNRLFSDVEECNVHLFDSVTYLRSTSLEAYVQSADRTRQTADEVRGGLAESWDREIADLYHMVQTYLEKGVELNRVLASYHGSEAPGENQYIAQLYSETQELINFINISFKDIYSAKLLSTQEMRRQIDALDKVFLLIQFALLAVSLLVFALFYRRVVKGLTRSVHQLTEFAARVRREPTTSETILLHTGDEVEVLADTINNMLGTIQRQFEQIRRDSQIQEQLQAVEMENMRIASALQSSQLSLLQERINPHFLFNTLNMIAQTAYLENAEETAHLMECTANYLRYNLGGDTKAVSVGQELANLREYAYIQQYRFGRRLAFRFEVDEAADNLRLPCMILQPLVENSIVHGVGHRPAGGSITVRTGVQDGRVFLEVEDDGSGISPQRLEELQAAFAAEELPDTQHMGMKNVYMRLMLYFNKDVELDITSDEHGTRIRIGLPAAGPA